MSRRSKLRRQQEAFEEIVRLSFEQDGIPIKIQPDIRLVLAEKKQYRQLREKREISR